MEYMTVKEAAEKWEISERHVQKYCSQGRVKGAMKFGTSWGIPVGADKPTDPRRERAKNRKSGKTERMCSEKLMPLMNTSFEPGDCIECIKNMKNSSKKDIALAEYYYFSGQPEKSILKAEPYLFNRNDEIRLSACLIYAYSGLSMGQIQNVRRVLKDIEKAAIAFNEGSPAQLRAAGSFAASAASVLLHLPIPEGLMTFKEYMPLLPPGTKVFALYVQAHYEYLCEEYKKSLGIVETALVMGAEKYPIPAIYLHLVAVMNHINLKQKEQAQEHLLFAWRLAKPDDLIEGLGEHHGLLGGTLEAVIKKNWPDDFKRIIGITYRFSENWRRIHNKDTGHDVADNLTTTEFAVAMLAARGWTNHEIGEYLNISSNTVKQYVSAAIHKLNIKRRQELKKYMLK